MGHGKLRKFAENETFSCLLQPDSAEILADGYFNLREHPIKGNWNGRMFPASDPSAPLVLELGCGKGEYTLDLARRNPGRNYIGVDIKGARLWRGAKTATGEGLGNVAFLRTRVEFLNSFFAPGEVDEIWLTFSDPQMKSENSRLSSPLFLERYRNILKPGGIVHLKTDSRFLHEYTRAVVEANGLKMLACTADLYGEARSNGDIPPEVYEVKTFYEKMFLEQGYKITYLSFIMDYRDEYLHPSEAAFDEKYWREEEGTRRSFSHAPKQKSCIAKALGITMACALLFSPLRAMASDDAGAQTSAGKLPKPAFSLGGYVARVTNTDGLVEPYLLENGHGGANLQMAFFTAPGSRNDVYNEMLNYPTFGFGVNYDVYNTMKFKAPTHIGNHVDLYTFMEGAFYRTRMFSVGYTLQLGLGITDVIYDVYTNPLYYNVGEPFTAYLALGPQFKFRPADNIELMLNTYWFHHSNGNVAMPNYGLNDLALGLGVRYYPEAPYTGQVRNLKLKHEFTKGFKYDIFATTGFHACKTEFEAFNWREPDPDRKRTVYTSHPRFGLSADVQYQYSLMCSSGIVVDAVYCCGMDEIERGDRKLNGDEAVDNAGGYNPWNVGIGAIHEFHYGCMSVFISVCRYLYHNAGVRENTSSLYERAGMRFYIGKLGRIFLGGSIRAKEFNNAEYFEFQMGVRI